ncbi:MAG: hypothetical protein K6G01_09790 [Eubacterium sp.]|nr:hypothetical protein [Eubacterium sp.]
MRVMLRKLSACTCAVILLLTMLPSAGTVTALADENDGISPEQALVMQEGEVTTISVKYGGQRWVCFTPTETGYYDFYSTDKGSYPMAYLYGEDPNGAREYVETNPLTFTRKLEAGKPFYFLAGSWNGDVFNMQVKKSDYVVIEDNQTYTLEPYEETTLEAQMYIREGYETTYRWYDEANPDLTLSQKVTCPVTAEKTASIKCLVTLTESETNVTEQLTINYRIVVASGLRIKGSTEQTVNFVPGDDVTMQTRANVSYGKLTYRWEQYDRTTRQRIEVEGENTPSLTSRDIENEETYYCTVSDEYGNSITITYYIEINNDFTAAPVDYANRIYMLEGQSVTIHMSVTHNYGEVYFTWKDQFLNYLSEVSDTCTVTTAKQYICNVKDDFGNSARWPINVCRVDSQFELNGPYRVILKPDEVSGRTLTVTPVGVDQDTPYEYQWYVKKGASFEELKGETTNTYALAKNPKESTFYKCVVKQGDITREIEVEVQIKTNLAFEEHEMNYNYDEHDNYKSVTLLSKASSDAKHITYHWCDSDGNTIAGETSSSLTVTDAERTTYTCYAQDEYGNTIENAFTIHDCLQNHVWDNELVTKKAAIGSHGTISYECYYCGATKTIKTAALPTISMTGFSVSGVKDYVYNGKAKKPAVTVKSGSTTLKKGTDYTVTYKNNVNAGKASVIVKGKGDYSGTITKTFTIKKAAASIALSKSKVTLKAKKIKKKKATATIKVKTKSDGKVSYKVVSGEKALKKMVSVNKKGKVIIKKGAPKGKVVIQVSISTGKNYKKTKSVKYTVVVK